MTDLTSIKKQRDEYYQNYYGQLEGYTIKKFEGMADDQDYGDDGFATFILEKSGHETLKIEVSRDPEGNGSGFLFIGGVK